MHVGPSFVAHAQPAERVQPADGSFNDPSRCSKAAAMCHADLGKLICHVALTQPTRMSAAAMSSITLHAIWSPARRARSTSNRRDRVDQRTQLGGIASMDAGEHHSQRDASSIGTDVVLASCSASIRRIGSRLLPQKLHAPNCCPPRRGSNRSDPRRGDNPAGCAVQLGPDSRLLPVAPTSPAGHAAATATLSTTDDWQSKLYHAAAARCLNSDPG